MKVVTSILSAVALVLVPCFTVHANELIAGPIPADFDFGVVTCSAANVIPLPAPQPTESITLELLDRTGKGVVGGPFRCSVVPPLNSCSVSSRAYLIGSGRSPFICHISSSNVALPPNPANIQGSICAEFDNSTACVQGLPFPF
jgi:hypothetical protein